MQLAGTPRQLSASLTQAGRPLGTLSRGVLTFSGLRADGYGLLARASGRATLGGTGSATLNLTGSGVSADLKASYAGGSFALGGAGTASGFQARLASTGSLRNGWNGTLDLSGGPAGVLTEPGHFTLGGPVARPLLSGRLGVAGAGVRLDATPALVQLRLTDGPLARASGLLNLDLRGGAWSGSARLSRPEGSLALALSGSAADPQARLDLRRGSWTASGTASAKAAALALSDGKARGRLDWDGAALHLDLPGLDLGGLDLAGLSGQLTASGTLDSRSLDGAATLGLKNARTPYTLPGLNLPLGGDLTASLSLKGGRLEGQGQLATAAGPLSFQLAQAERGGPYSGRLGARLRQSGGSLDADLTANGAGISGTLKAQDLPLALGGLSAKLSGSARLDGQTFSVQAGASADAVGQDARVSLSGSGGLADLLPALGRYAAVRPSPEGYSLRASLSGLDLAGLKVAPGLSGPLSGDALISDGGGTFVLRSGALRVGQSTLSARVEGTL
ncbi:MAG: translocation/assembly module TamB domain-containing protein, partial [Deinococcus sp.]